MQFSPRDIVVLFSGFLGIVFSVYLFRNPGDRPRTGQLLASFLLLQGLLLVVSVFAFRHFLFMQWERVFRGLLSLESSALFVDGLLLYAYCSALLENRHLSLATLARHLAVGLLLVVFTLTVYAHTDVVSYFDPTAANRPPLVGLTYTLMQAVRVFYGLLCLQLLARYRQRMPHQFSNPDRRDVVWLFTLIKGFVAYRIGWLCFHFYFTAAAHYGWNMLDYKYVVGGGMFLLDASWLGVNIGLLYFGFKYSPQFLSLGAEQVPTEPQPPAVDSLLIQKLETAMTDERLYINPDLRLDDLARQLRQPPRTLSELINQHYQTNFCEFINRYRIDESKRLLQQKARVNVLDISLEVGFNSKSAFNRAFKKATELTPLQFRKQVLEC